MVVYARSFKHGCVLRGTGTTYSRLIGCSAPSYGHYRAGWIVGSTVVYIYGAPHDMHPHFLRRGFSFSFGGYNSNISRPIWWVAPFDTLVWTSHHLYYDTVASTCSMFHVSFFVGFVFRSFIRRKRPIGTGYVHFPSWVLLTYTILRRFIVWFSREEWFVHLVAWVFCFILFSRWTLFVALFGGFSDSLRLNAGERLGWIFSFLPCFVYIHP